jgi:hypothetical protein
MRPIRSILDASFCYVPSVATSVASTWRRAGWHPTTEQERKARGRPTVELVVDCIGATDGPTTAARRVWVRVSGTSRDPLPVDDPDLGTITLCDVTPSRKSYLENENPPRSAKVARRPDPPDDRQVTGTTMWHIGRGKAQRNVQDPRSTSAYPGAMVFPLSERK